MLKILQPQPDMETPPRIPTTPFNKVQRRVVLPSPRPVTVVLGLEGVVIVPLPPTTVQTPVPVVGRFPANVVEEPHTV